jgi:dTDP-4-dehydrorhamnose reductase
MLPAVKVLVTGARGMLGRALLGELTAREIDAVGLARSDVELSDPRAVRPVFEQARPDVVIHSAAFTKVDLAESEPERAFADNAQASAQVADATRHVGARLVAFSTDYVFAGDLDRPYHEHDAPGPTTVYGRTKLAAEAAIRAHCPDHLILRIAWLYGRGGPSFVHAIVGRAREGHPLKVVDDQLGNPTSCAAVATLTADLLDVPLVGTAHATCEGDATWYQFAQAFLEKLGLDVRVDRCTSAEFVRPAPRPANSRLDNRVLRVAGLRPMPHWRDALDAFLADEKL